MNKDRFEIVTLVVVVVLLLLLGLCLGPPANAGSVVCTEDDDYITYCAYVWDGSDYEYDRPTVCWTDPAGYTYCERQ